MGCLVPKHFSFHFESTEITNYKDISVYKFYKEVCLCIIEPKCLKGKLIKV